jgi:hypothetical protein
MRTAAGKPPPLAVLDRAIESARAGWYHERLAMRDLAPRAIFLWTQETSR